MSRPSAPYLVRFSSNYPDLITALVPPRFFERGNAGLVIDPARPVQLRPCRSYERQHLDWSDPDDNALLIQRRGCHVLSAHFVTVAPDRMADTPENVAAAIEDLAGHEPMHAFRLRRAISRAAEACARSAMSGPPIAGDLFAASTSKRAGRRAGRTRPTKRGGPQ